MKQFIIESLQGYAKAAPQTAGGVSIIPLLASQSVSPHYLSLRQAFRNGSLTITEISESGSVPTLKVINRGKEVVLLLDGEELQGAKQNRILNTSILVPPESEIVVPVSCTERGRWHHVSREFTESENVLPARQREQKVEHVKENLLRNMCYAADQGRIWQSIDEMQHKHKVYSRTSAMREVYEDKRAKLEEYCAQLTLQDGQTGIFVEVAGKFAGLDLVSLPDVWRDLHDKIIRSYLIDLMGRDITAPVAEQESLDRIIAELDNAEFLPFKSVGLGEDLRIEYPSLTGSFLIWEGQAVHCAIYPKRPSRAHEPNHSPRGRSGEEHIVI